MKELSIEEKAKRYDDVVSKLGRFMAQGVNPLITRADVQDFFPELKESEDERIRKSIIKFLIDVNNGAYTKSELEIASWIAWLEKQGEQKPNQYSGTSFEYNGHIWGMCARDNGVEILFDGELKAFLSSEKSFIYPIHPQPYLAPKSAIEAIKEEKVDNQNCVKPANKVEPKFHEEDWVVYDGWTTQIKEVYEYGYSNSHQGFIPKKREEEMRLWTIQDAKDGDVLVDRFSKDNIIILYKGINPKLSVLAYCGWNGYNLSIKTNGLGYGNLDNTNYYPATKEQRGLLFQKMKEAGYEWDAEKKELKKIEQTPAWSAEDESWFKEIELMCLNFSNDVDYKENFFTWLKSLKDKVQPQPKQEWSEEDEQYLLVCKNALEKYQTTDKWDANIIFHWLENKLKCLRPQNRWKPSDEQMKALGVATNISNIPEKEYQELEKLYQDLKKLKEA